MSAVRAALDALPNVELHCHIEGTVRPQTVIELAQANRVPLPTADPTELYRYERPPMPRGSSLRRGIISVAR